MSEKKKFTRSPNKKGEMKDYATKVSKSNAKLAYFQGESNMSKLCEIGGCCDRTFKDSWLPEFEREKKEMLLSFSNSSLKLCVTDVELNKHLDYINTLSKVSESYEKDISTFDGMRNSLKLILEQLEGHPDFNEKDFTNILNLLQTYVLSKKAYDTTVTNFIRSTNEWSKATGVEAHHSAAAARIKEAERLRGKDDAGRNPLSPTSEGDETNKASHDPFFNNN